MRRGMFLLTLILGLVLAGVALLTAAPPPVPLGVVLSQPSSPGLPFAPLLFILGVMLAFLSAVVYELFPDKRR